MMRSPWGFEGAMALALLLPRVMLLLSLFGMCGAMEKAVRDEFVEKTRAMFYHGYEGYLEHAFPHDELNPLTASYTDTLVELGNAKSKKGSTYRGVALTMIDSLSTLAVLGNSSEFSRAVNWLSDNVSFDVDARVHVFECNIRILGGLLSGHMLAEDSELGLMPNYDGRLLLLAQDVGDRLMTAFVDAYDVPYAWVNLQKGVEQGETTEQCTAGTGTLILEFGMLSHLTGDDKYYEAAYGALQALWAARSKKDLMGNTFNLKTMKWMNTNSGTGAGIDSFYEYLFKAYVMFGDERLLHMFEDAYSAATKHLKSGDWYVEASMQTGQHTHVHFNSLSAFWPGLQVAVGDLTDAIATQEAFFSVWSRFGGLPERFVLSSSSAHSSERYYPLRPELIESTYHLYRATNLEHYLQMGKTLYETLQAKTWTPHGYAALRDVVTGEKEDRMHSFFLAETVKYLYLLFDNDNFAHDVRWIFTTEGHLFRLSSDLNEKYRNGPPSHRQNRGTSAVKKDGTSTQCDAKELKVIQKLKASSNLVLEAQARSAPKKKEFVAPGTRVTKSDFTVDVGEGSFLVSHVKGDSVNIRNLGNAIVEVTNYDRDKALHSMLIMERSTLTTSLTIESTGVGSMSAMSMSAMYAAFSPLIGVHETLQKVSKKEVKKAITSTKVFDVAAAMPLPACDELSSHSKQAIKGKMVLVVRGACTFVEKALRIQNAGGKGLIVSNNGDDIFSMSEDGSGRVVQIPVLMVDAASGAAMLRELVPSENSYLDAASGLPRVLKATLHSTLAPHLRITSDAESFDVEEPAQTAFRVEGGLFGFVLTTNDNWRMAVSKDDTNNHFLQIY